MENINRRNLMVISVSDNVWGRVANNEQIAILQRTNPTEKPPFDCYIHNADTDLIVGEFTCDRVTEVMPINHSPDDIERQLCMTRSEIVDYCRNTAGFAYHISDLRIHHDAKSIADIKNTTSSPTDDIEIDETDDFTRRVIQYCLDNGACIRHTKISPDGTRNYTTTAETIAASPAHDKIRYVGPKLIRYLLGPDVIDKTRYILNLRDAGSEADTTLIHLERWIATCKHFNCNEMTYDDATRLINTLWGYDIDILDIAYPNRHTESKEC